MDFDPEQLIVAVKKRPLLYDKSVAEYSNKMLKNSAWMNVAQDLNEDWDYLRKAERENKSKEAQAKWKNLRDYFRRELAQKHARTGAKKRTRYRFFKQLLFLVPFLNNGMTPGNIQPPAIIDSGPESEEYTEDIPSPSSNGKSKLNRIKSKIILKKKHKKLIQEMKRKSNINDSEEDKAFCKSLIPSLKKLGDSDKLLAKIEILNVLRRFSTQTNQNCMNNRPIFQQQYNSAVQPQCYPQPQQSFTQTFTQGSLIQTPIQEQQSPLRKPFIESPTREQFTEPNVEQSFPGPSITNVFSRSNICCNIETKKEKDANIVDYNSSPPTSRRQSAPSYLSPSTAPSANLLN